MTEGFGINKEQAEKCASINGLKWFQENKQEDIKKLLQNSVYSQSLKACFMQYGNLQKYVEDENMMDVTE
jgi:hypothetical protein